MHQATHPSSEHSVASATVDRRQPVRASRRNDFGRLRVRCLPVGSLRTVRQACGDSVRRSAPFTAPRRDHDVVHGRSLRGAGGGGGEGNRWCELLRVVPRRAAPRAAAHAERVATSPLTTSRGALPFSHGARSLVCLRRDGAGERCQRVRDHFRQRAAAPRVVSRTHRAIDDGDECSFSSKRCRGRVLFANLNANYSRLWSICLFLEEHPYPLEILSGLKRRPCKLRLGNF